MLIAGFGAIILVKRAQRGRPYLHVRKLDIPFKKDHHLL